MPERSMSRMNSRLSVDESEAPTQRIHVSRSPHPYQRSNAQLPSSRPAGPPLTNMHLRKPKQANGVARGHEDPKSEYFDVDGRKRRKTSISPSESGTEADDERAALMLRGLPAPPVRARKGLKAVSEPGGGPRASPLLTPSILDECSNSRPGSGVDSQSSFRSQAGVRISFVQDKTKKRQYEVVRRILETLSLFVVGYVGFQGAPIYLRIEMKYHLSVVMGVYGIYSIRHLWRWRLLSGKQNSPQFRIPVSYDPAPLLYPVFLPSCVAVSLVSASEDLVLPNIVLGLCSLPAETIPLRGYGYYNVQWLISLVPCILMSNSPELFFTHLSGYSFPIPQEVIVMLYPLHQALVLSLNFLCTSSLLPSELQLLSIALINLLLYSTTPQAIILKALLWIGGIALFVFCKHVLQWTVELARVPSWRFRRSRFHVRGRSVLFRAVNDSLGGILSKIGYFKTHENDSDSEIEYMLVEKASRNKTQNSKAMREVKTHKSDPKGTLEHQGVAVDGIVEPTPIHANGKADACHPETARPRRHTFPNYLAETLHKVGFRPSISSPGIARLKLYRSLTCAQATVLRWLYSLYVYFIVAATIAIPIRMYIGQRALQCHEPVGWAIGYLLGDIPAFRLQTILWNLERWICLPERSEDKPSSLCRAEALRQITLGAANTRILICVYCIACIGVGLAAVFSLTAVVEVDTRRKVFHGMMVVMFLPTVFVDPAFIALAFSLILAIFLLLDLVRASQLPPISKPLTYFLAPYVDGRDHRGPIIVSHIFLLIGCAIPLWLSLAAVEQSGLKPFEGWEVKKRDMSMVSGIICVGMGDAAASLIGRRFGRRRWPWSGGKSLEGSLAFALAVILGLLVARLWLVFGGWEGDKGDKWIATLGKATVSAAGSSFTEAVLTGGNDNVIVPVILWLLVRGLKI